MEECKLTFLCANCLITIEINVVFDMACTEAYFKSKQWGTSATLFLHLFVVLSVHMYTYVHHLFRDPMFHVVFLCLTDLCVLLRLVCELSNMNIMMDNICPLEVLPLISLSSAILARSASHLASFHSITECPVTSVSSVSQWLNGWLLGVCSPLWRQGSSLSRHLPAAGHSPEWCSWQAKSMIERHAR